MNIKCLKNYNDLQQELEDAKGNLVMLNDNIKRIVGRPARISKESSRFEKKCLYETKRIDVDTNKKITLESVNCSKRINDSRSVFNRLSSPVDRNIEVDSRPRLTSRVIRELPSRQEIVAVQCADSESKARNRRIFGSLMGTLHKFCQEESRLKQKEEKKVKIEKKIEEQEILERESLKREREALFHDRKRKQNEIKSLEQKIIRVKDFERWEISMNNLKPFIKTKAKPSIYFRPKVLSANTEKLLLDCQDTINQLVHVRRGTLNEDLMKLEDNLKSADVEEHKNDVENNVIFYPQYPSMTSSDGLVMPATVPKEKKTDPDFDEVKIPKLTEYALEEMNY